MSQEPLISIIVPVYKVEKYLDQCVESIVNQTYRNLEIILVDDGSPDQCPTMCDKWAERDVRIKVTHKDNGGASDSRNAGLKSFRGEYAMFVDSDDLISEDLVETLYMGCVDHHAFLAMCSLQNFTEDEPSLKSKQSCSKVMTGREVCLHFFDYFASGPVAKLYHKSILTNHTFIVGRKAGEDAAFNYPIFYNQQNVVYLCRAMYFYRHYEASATGAYSLNLMDELDTLKEMLCFYRAKKDTKIFYAMSMEYFARILAHQNKIKMFLGGVPDAMNFLDLQRSQLIRSMPSFCMRFRMMLYSLFPRIFLRLFFKRQSCRQGSLRGSI